MVAVCGREPIIREVRWGDNFLKEDAPRDVRLDTNKQVYACVCVRERERKRARMRETTLCKNHQSLVTPCVELTLRYVFDIPS